MVTISSTWLIVALVGGVACGIVCWGAGHLLLERGRRLLPVDVPGGRRLHEVPTPRGGGLAIPFTVAVAVGVAALTLQGALATGSLFAVLAFALPNGILGAVDDFRPLRSRLKFGLQLLLAVIVVGGGVQIRSIDLAPFATVPLGPLGAPLTALWLVWMTNVYNFMDGLDALAAVSGIGFLMTLALVALVSIGPTDPLVLIACISGAGALAGFLVHNRPPARVFMGDGGALFIGALLGVIVVLLAARQDGGASVPLPVVVLPLWSFLWDATFTIVFRMVRREDWLRPHRRHLFQRMILAGRTHSEVRRLYFTILSLGCAASLTWLLAPPPAQLVVTLGTIVASAWLPWRVACDERRGG